MPYVIVTADQSYGGGTAEAGALSRINTWASRLDDLDGDPTPRQGIRGGRIRCVRIPRLARPRDAGAADRLRELLTQTYRRAALLTERGQVGLAVGHGHADRSGAWVDLAPSGLLRVDVGFTEELHRLLEAGPRAPRELSKQEALFVALGEALREDGRVRRLDFYACAVGASDQGQRLLDWIHALWEIPVRGLRGDLEVEAAPSWGSSRSTPRARVIAPSPSVRNRHFGRWYVDRLIDTPSLWRRSRGRRPESSLPPYGESSAPQPAFPPPPSFDRDGEMWKREEGGSMHRAWPASPEAIAVSDRGGCLLEGGEVRCWGWALIGATDELRDQPTPVPL